MDGDRDLRAWVVGLALGVGFFLIGLQGDLHDVRGWVPPAVLDGREPPPLAPRGWTTPADLRRQTRPAVEDRAGEQLEGPPVDEPPRPNERPAGVVTPARPPRR